jgi:uncharacterized SAM-binding protein YcdF (DUF218 family)
MGSILSAETAMSWLSYSSLIPPNLFILLTVIGLVIAWRWTRLGLVVATLGGALLYLVSTPVVADYLIGSVKDLAGAIPVLPSGAPPGAIIVLSADYRKSDTPDQSFTVGPMTLERLADAAREERRLGLPVLVSGGTPNGLDDSLAGMMSTVLEDDFRVPVRWREDRSRTTFENAAFSADILRRAGVPSALLITHCRDMARALWSFYAVGYPVIPAICSPQQTGRRGPDESSSLSVSSFFPQVPSLLVSYRALHELIGLAWYRYRYRDAMVRAGTGLAAGASRQSLR